MRVPGPFRPTEPVDGLGRPCGLGLSALAARPAMTPAVWHPEPLPRNDPEAADAAGGGRLHRPTPGSFRGRGSGAFEDDGLRWARMPALFLGFSRGGGTACPA